jgi:dual specificity phosphatase 3
MMADFNFITERLACGAQINGAADIDALIAAGITHVIDAQIERNDGDLLRAGMIYVWDPTADDGQPKPSIWFQRAIDVALGAFCDPGAIVLTHCAAGVNRGPSLAYAIMRALGWRVTDAISALHQYRPQTMTGVRYAVDAETALKQLGWTK